MRKETVGFAMCGSYCTYEKTFQALEQLVQEFEHVIPILSENSASTDTRFGMAQAHIERLTAMTGKKPITAIRDAEPIGPRKLLDLIIVAPCTGNTLGKLSGGITDSAVTMAVKAHLRNERPVLLAISTNDGLGASGKNIMELMNRKHIYMVPFGQDDPEKKPASLVADMTKITEAAIAALEERQLQPVLI